MVARVGARPEAHTGGDVVMNDEDYDWIDSAIYGTLPGGAAFVVHGSGVDIPVTTP